MMLIQLHWQNRDDLNQTEMVGQCGFDDAEKAMAWVKELIDRRRDEMPEGWCPLVCTEDSPLFWKAVRPQGIAG